MCLYWKKIHNWWVQYTLQSIHPRKIKFAKALKQARIGQCKLIYSSSGIQAHGFPHYAIFKQFCIMSFEFFAYILTHKYWKHCFEPVLLPYEHGQSAKISTLPKDQPTCWVSVSKVGILLLLLCCWLISSVIMSILLCPS